MRQDQQIKIINRALDLISKRETEMVDHAVAIPVEAYTSEAHFEKEREMLFRRFPLIIGFSSQVARPGDYFTHDLTGVPLLVTRDLSGKLNAFLNACRHRGSQVTAEPCGQNQKVFVCPYHGWVYEADGKLRGVTHPVGFPDFDKEAHGLVRLAVAERYGMVFVLPTPGLTFEIDEFLGPVLKDLESFGLDTHMMVHPTEQRTRMNWKLQMDTSHETYHFHYLHRQRSGTIYFNNLAVTDYAKPHARIVCPQRSIVNLAGTDSAKWRIQEHTGVHYSIFPNTGLFFHDGFAHVTITFPIDPNTSVLQGGMLVPAGPITEEREMIWKLHHDSFHGTVQADVVIAESMQTNLRSGANTELLFGRYEHVGGYFHAAIEEALEGKLTPHTSHKHAGLHFNNEREAMPVAG